MGRSIILPEGKSKNVAFPVVVSGPSGVGKTCLCRGVLADCDDVAYSVSATTRNRRDNEVNGRDYHFVEPDRFRAMAQAGELLEWAEVHGDLYGTPRHSVLPFLAQGKLVIMDLDVQGGLSMRKVFPGGVFVFVVPPSFEILEERLRTRRTESEDALETRLRNAREEMKFRKHYDYMVVNDDLDDALSRLKSIIAAEKCSMQRLFPCDGEGVA
ncbi:MAG: guanylate kinase [Candidatus Eisenbacteria bacterium]|nr:guanylate kinase [Candidatus Eisenbacteria bacterium]